MANIRHATLAAARPSGGLGGTEWDAAHTITDLAISEVTGLQNALDGKQAELVSGTNIKTVNGVALLGSGNIVIDGGSGGSSSWGDISGTLAAQTDLVAVLDAKQPLAAVLTGTTASFTTAQQTKLAGIATGATVNATDAQLRDRATHTGAQAISTVTGLQTALDGKVASDPTGITGADAITNIVSLTQAEYDAIGTPSATTFYVVTA